MRWIFYTSLGHFLFFLLCRCQCWPEISSFPLSIGGPAFSAFLWMSEMTVSLSFSFDGWLLSSGMNCQSNPGCILVYFLYTDSILIIPPPWCDHISHGKWKTLLTTSFSWKDLLLTVFPVNRVNPSEGAQSRPKSHVKCDSRDRDVAPPLCSSAR